MKKMTTFLFFSVRILKISPYINLKKIFGRTLGPHPGGARGQMPPPPLPPLATPLIQNILSTTGLILTFWSSVGTVTPILDIIIERVDVVKLIRHLAMK